MDQPVKFKVTNRATGSVFEVAADETILDGARRAGMHLTYSCLSGTCAICRARVIAGEWHYPIRQASSLDGESDDDVLLVCRAVPRSDMTIVARESAALRDIQTRQIEVALGAIERQTDDVAKVRLTLPEGEALDYLAGQYLDFILDDGKRRAFSIACAPGEAADGIELHVRHVPGGGFTDFLFEAAEVGDRLRIEAPLGTFFLRDRSKRPLICVAGGTGFAPIKAIIEQYLANGESRPLDLYWGARTAAELYDDELARSWERQNEAVRYRPVLSEAGSDSRWRGRRGLVHEAVLADHPDLSRMDLYMSGPPALIDAGRRAFLAAGLPEAHIYYDSFEFAPDVLANMVPAAPD